MVECSFCGKKFENKGKMFVKKSGSVLYFCTSKCEKNVALKRKPVEIRWTKQYHDNKAKTKK